MIAAGRSIALLDGIAYQVGATLAPRTGEPQTMNQRQSHRKAIALAVFASLAAFATSAGAAPPATGTVTLDGETWTVADAVAYLDGDNVTVAVSNAAFDRKEFAKDGKLDSMDLFRHSGGEVQNFSIDVGADGTVQGYEKRTGRGGGGGINSIISEGFTLESRTDDRIRGRIAFEDGKLAADFAFDVDVEATLARAGTPLPFGGRDLGTALLAHFEAMASGDKQRIFAMAPPDRRAEQESMMADPQAEALLGFLAATTPRKVKVTGGTIDGDRATLDFTGENEGKKVKGTVEGTRVEGRWYFNDVSTSSGD